MNANELVTKAIREGIAYARVANNPAYLKVHEAEDIDRMASTLSAGLIVLTEDELFQIIFAAFNDGSHDEVLTGYEYTSRIMREVKGGE